MLIIVSKVSYGPSPSQSAEWFLRSQTATFWSSQSSRHGVRRIQHEIFGDNVRIKML